MERNDRDQAGEVRLVTSEDFGIPRPGMTIDPERTAIVVTDPQNDFLSPDGVTWGVVGESVTENRTVENLELLFQAAQTYGVPVFVSPHYYYPHDHDWQFEGALETLMHDIQMFDRKGALHDGRLRGLRRRLARALQAVHRGRRRTIVGHQSRTRSTAPRRTTWSCSCASAASIKRRSSAACPRTFAPSRTCASSSSRDSR